MTNGLDSMKRHNPKPTDKRLFNCPQCGKQRLVRPVDHCVSKDTQEFKKRDGTSISLLVDICVPCTQKNYHTYFEPTRTDIRKVLKAMSDEAEASPDVSLEELL